MQPKQWSPLSEDFRPPTLLFRDQQLEEMLKLATHPIPCNMWIQGDKGLGKTLTARFFTDEVNARHIGKSYRIEWRSKLTDTLKEFNDTYGFKIPDYTLSASTIAKQIISETSKNDLVCIVIDEPQKSRFFRDVDDTTFTLFQSFLAQRKLSIVFLSQLRFPLLKNYFSPDTLSRLQLKPILFPNYDAPEIVEILKQRLTYMLEENQYELDALVTLAGHIRRIGGDIREALDILRFAIEETNSTLNKGVVLKAIEWGKDRWWKNELTSLPPHWAYILFLTAATCVKYKEATQPYVMRKYLDNTKHLKIDPIGRRTIYYAFSKLGEKGYFGQRQQGFGRRRVTMLFMDEGDRDHIIKAGREIEWELILQESLGPKSD